MRSALAALRMAEKQDFSPFNDSLPPSQPVGRRDVGPIPETTNPSQGSSSGTDHSGAHASASATRAAAEASISKGEQQSAFSTTASGRASDDLQKAVGDQLKQRGADVVYDDQNIDISAAANKEIVREAPLVKERIHEETTGTLLVAHSRRSHDHFTLSCRSSWLICASRTACQGHACAILALCPCSSHAVQLLHFKIGQWC